MLSEWVAQAVRGQAQSSYAAAERAPSALELGEVFEFGK